MRVGFALIALGGCSYRRAVKIEAPVAEAQRLVVEESKARGYYAGVKGNKVAIRGVSKYNPGYRVEFEAEVTPTEGGSYVELSSGPPDNHTHNVFPDHPERSYSDWIGFDLVVGDRPATLAPYFQYTAGPELHGSGTDHGATFGGFLAFRVMARGAATSNISQRRLAWVNVGADCDVTESDCRAWLGLTYGHHRWMKLASHTIKTSPVFHYQLAFAMAPWRSSNRASLILVAPASTFGLVSEVSWNLSGTRDTTWALGFRIPLPFSLGGGGGGRGGGAFGNGPGFLSR
ncbi:MAG: hypothetical protein IPL79_07670 [Myxococcales bacterium]|nr:hypothetical protein [Myxococcales bacterium]